MVLFKGTEMIDKIKKIYSSDFVKNNLQLISGTVIAQAINFGFNIVLTRLYAPESWGVLSFFLISCSIFLVISSFKLDINLITAKSEKEIKRLLNYSFTITFVVSIITFIIFLVLKIFSNTSVKTLEWWWIVGYLVSTYLLSGRQILWMLALKYKLFSLQSRTLIGEAFIVNSIATLFFYFEDLGLFIGNFFSQLFGFLWLFINILKSKYYISLNDLKPKLLPIKLFKKILFIQRHNIIQGYIDLFQIYTFTLIFSNQMSVIGYYFLCIRVLQLPLRLIFGPISNVFFRTLFDKKLHSESMKGFYLKVLFMCIALLVPIVLVIELYSNELFQFVFGDEWLEAGKYAKILIFWIGLDVIKTPMIQVFYLFKKQNILNVLSFCSVALTIIFLIYGKYNLSITLVLQGMALIGALFSLIIIYTSFNIVNIMITL